MRLPAYIGRCVGILVGSESPNGSKHFIVCQVKQLNIPNG